MSVLKKVSVGLCLIGIIGAANSHAATSLNYLEPVQVRTLPDGIGLVLKFREETGSIQELDEHALSYGEGWAQIQIPGSYIDPPKQSLRLERGPLTEVFAYQFDEDVVRVRFYARGSDNGLRNRIHLKKEAGGLMVTIPAVKTMTAPSPRAESLPAPKSAPGKPEERPLSGRPAEEADSLPPTSVHAPDMPIPETPVRQPPPALPLKTKAPPPAPIVGAAAPDLLFSSLKMAAALVFVLSLMLGCYYLFKKTLGRKMGFAGKERLIKVVSSAYIGPKKSIALVEVAGETLVLGISGEQMTLLSKMIPPEEPLRELADAPGTGRNHGPRDFAEALKSAGNGIPAGENLWAQKES